MKTMKWTARVALSLVVACGAWASIGCGSSEGPSAPAAKGGSGPKDVSLAPLPLKVKMPGSEAGTTMDKSNGGRKSVGVTYDEVQSGFNVSEPTEKTFDEVKKRVVADAIYPFKRWVSEGANQAVEEFEFKGAKGYVAWSWREVAGKPYVCQSTGMSGLKTPELAQKVIKVCETLAAR
jgi:hypothetical protein